MKDDRKRYEDLAALALNDMNDDQEAEAVYAAVDSGYVQVCGDSPAEIDPFDYVFVFKRGDDRCLALVGFRCQKRRSDDCCVIDMRVAPWAKDRVGDVVSFVSSGLFKHTACNLRAVDPRAAMISFDGVKKAYAAAFEDAGCDLVDGRYVLRFRESG